MSTFQITITANPYFKNPVLIQTENYNQKELENALKQYMYSWLWLKPEEINEVGKVPELFYQKEKTFPLKLAGHIWKVQELETENENLEDEEMKILETEEMKIVDAEQQIIELENLENSETVAEILTESDDELEPKSEPEEIITDTPKIEPVKNFNQKNKKHRK